MRISDWSSTCALPISAPSPARYSRRKVQQLPKRAPPQETAEQSCGRSSRLSATNGRRLQGVGEPAAEARGFPRGMAAGCRGRANLRPKLAVLREEWPQVRGSSEELASGDGPGELGLDHEGLVGADCVGPTEVGGVGRARLGLDADGVGLLVVEHDVIRSEEHTSELQSLMRISYAVFCLKKKKRQHDKE